MWNSEQNEIRKISDQISSDTYAEKYTRTHRTKYTDVKRNMEDLRPLSTKLWEKQKQNESWKNMKFEISLGKHDIHQIRLEVASKQRLDKTFTKVLNVGSEDITNITTDNMRCFQRKWALLFSFFLKQYIIGIRNISWSRATGRKCPVNLLYKINWKTKNPE